MQIDIEVTQMLELADKDIKTGIIAISHMFTVLGREMEDSF